MKKLFIISTFSIFFWISNLYPNNLCIQIAAYPQRKITSIISDKKVYSFIKQKKDCIIDERLNGKFYGVCCGNFKSYKVALKKLKKLKKKFSNPFIRRFNKKKSYHLSDLLNIKTKSKTIIKLKTKKGTNIKIKNKAISKTSSKEVKHEIINVAKLRVEKEKKKKSDINNLIIKNIVNSKENSNYFVISLKEYLEKLKETDTGFKTSKLRSEIYEIDSLIEKYKYKPNIYFSIDSTASKTTSFKAATTTATFDATAGIHFDWHIYDAEKKYLNERKIIFNRLSKLNLLAAKDKLFINGINIYNSLWYIQKIIDKFDFLIIQQKKLVKIAQKKDTKGESLSLYSFIDSLNDYYNLELSIADLKETFAQNEIIFRQSIDLSTNKPLYLIEPIYTPLHFSLAELQKEAIAKNKELAKLQEEYNLSKTDIAIALAKKGVNINLYSFAGYGISQELEGAKSFDHGLQFNVGASITFPFGKREDIELEIKKKKLEASIQALSIADKIKALLKSITQLYNSIKKLKYKNEILQSQLKLLKKRLKISYNRYIKGEDSYNEYSSSLKAYITTYQNFLLNKSLIHSSELQMYILVGRSIQ